MKPLSRQCLLVPILLLAASVAGAQTNNATSGSSHAGHAEPAVPPIKWGPVPDVLPPGAEIAVLQGNPFAEGVYTLRLKMPNGYKVPPHFHPTDEMVTVISGNVLFAHGDNIDRKLATTLHTGQFIDAEKNMHHYVIASGPAVVQVHGMGPFAITYVHPQDDPRTAKKP
ncbi:MAG: cupin domain-containing protein [Gemmatimonadaceae bacterium]